MKRTFLISLSTLAVGLIAHANTITCLPSPVSQAGGTGTGATITCAAIDAGAGFTIGNLQMLLASDYTNGPVGTTSGTNVHVVYTPSANFGTHTEDVSGGFSSNASATDGVNNSGPAPWLAQTILVGTQTLASFTVADVFSVTAGGPVASATANVFLTYTPQQISTGTPEPATLGLMGCALLGLGFLARRKK
jgi:hypothetical protein